MDTEEDPYTKLRRHYDAVQRRAEEWRCELDGDEFPLVSQAYGAFLRGRLSIPEARRVLGYPDGATINPFEGMERLDPDEVDSDSDLLYEAWVDHVEHDQYGLGLPQYPYPLFNS